MKYWTQGTDVSAFQLLFQPSRDNKEIHALSYSDIQII